MALEAHISELVERHRVLELELKEEMAHPLADDVKVAELKKRKLHIKDEIARLQTHFGEVA